MKARQDCSIELRDLTLAYGERDIIRGLNLDVRRGEILSLLSPSGCGKTTTLHAIAGLIVPRKGSVVIDGVDQTDVPINRRNVGMVFQGYALFPHMTVFDNVSYGLRIKSVAKAEIRERTMRPRPGRHGTVRATQAQAAFRRPAATGGHRAHHGDGAARAAAGRTLSNLDAKLRHEIRGDLKRILRELSITSVFVTHDQEEGDVPVRPDRADEGRRHRPAVLPARDLQQPGQLVRRRLPGQHELHRRHPAQPDAGPHRLRKSAPPKPARC